MLSRWTVFASFLICVALTVVADAQDKPPEKTLRIGMIGLDTSHCLAFTKLLNTPDSPEHVPAVELLPFIPKAVRHRKQCVASPGLYDREIRMMGVEINENLEDMIAGVDAVLLETNDGRPHLEQVIPVLKAGKRSLSINPSLALWQILWPSSNWQLTTKSRCSVLRRSVSQRRSGGSQWFDRRRDRL